MWIRRYYFLSNRFCAPSDEKEAPRHAVYNLPECVDTLDVAGDRIALDKPIDRHPRITPPERPHRIDYDRPGRGIPDYDGIS